MRLIPRRRLEPELVDIAELEREIERDRRAADKDLTKRINAAICAEQGHVPAQDGALSEDIEITAWGMLEPIRIGPHCSRCGANLGTAQQGCAWIDEET